MSGLISIKMVLHADGIPKKKKNSFFWKKSEDSKKASKITK